MIELYTSENPIPCSNNPLSNVNGCQFCVYTDRFLNSCRQNLLKYLDPPSYDHCAKRLSTIMHDVRNL